MTEKNFYLEVVNHADMPGAFCLYQIDPTPDSNALSLVWLAKRVNAGTHVLFEWEVTWGFIWQETAPNAEEDSVIAYQTVPATLQHDNKIGLAKKNDAYLFEHQEDGPEGRLTIHTDGTVPTSQTLAGVTMDGKGIYADRVRPNYQWYYEPSPNYMVGFGNYRQRAVVEESSAFVEPKKITYPYQVSALSIELKSDNTWTAPTPLSESMLKRLLREKDKEEDSPP